jgi:photosystem II stability/assembly factor-like uncharacterized protein
MKKLLLYTLSFFIYTLSFSQQFGWKNISTNIPTEADLSDVFFVSDDEGWITSSFHAEIYHTTDGGESFEIQSTQYPTYAIHMFDADTGYSGGAQGRVYRTTDGGNNWLAIGSTGNPPLDLDFVTASQGYACGDYGTVYSVNSEGATNLNCQSNSTFRGISAPSVNNVWVCGGSSVFLYNGSTFSGQSAPSGTYNDIHFINNMEGWVVGNSGVIGHTTDGGANWITQTNPDTQNRSLYGVFFLDSDNGWAVGIGGVILHTTNGGTTWTVEGNGLTTQALSGVHFTSTTNGYVVGNGKTLLNFTQVSGIGDEVEHLKFEIYPNPAKDKIQIGCSEFKTESGIIEILSLDGKKILEKEIETGIENIELDLNNLKSGMYFCKISTDKKSTTKKMIME